MYIIKYKLHNIVNAAYKKQRIEVYFLNSVWT